MTAVPLPLSISGATPRRRKTFTQLRVLGKGTRTKKEVFIDVTAGEIHEVDLLIQSKFKGQSYSFLLHVENESSSKTDFNKRMFSYFARLHEKFALPIYPIVVFSTNTCTVLFKIVDCRL